VHSFADVDGATDIDTGYQDPPDILIFSSAKFQKMPNYDRLFDLFPHFHNFIIHISHFTIIVENNDMIKYSDNFSLINYPYEKKTFQSNFIYCTGGLRLIDDHVSQCR
jgi:hypothetical protein